MAISVRQAPGLAGDNAFDHAQTRGGPDAHRRGPEGTAMPLTARELQVLALVAEGCSNKAIGLRLGISERTVKSHLTYVMAKLRTSDRTHAVVTAVRLGWLDL